MRDGERGDGAESLRRRLSRRLTPGSRRSSRRPGLTAIRDLGRGARGCSSTTRSRAPSSSRASTARSSTSARGGGAPGIPLAHALPEREVVLLEAERRKCEFLERVGAAERARRLGPRRGAGDRLGRCRRREGARAAADRGRVVPAARARGRRGRALGRPVGRARAGRSRRRAARRRARGGACRASSSSARPARLRPASRAASASRRSGRWPRRKVREKPLFKRLRRPTRR